MELGVATDESSQLAKGLVSRLKSKGGRLPGPPKNGYPFPDEKETQNTSRKISTVQFAQPGRIHAKPSPSQEQNAARQRPRYHVSIYGCSSQAYGIIAAKDEHTWHALLGMPTFFQEHPRRDAAALRKLMNLKPFFISYKESFNWISLGESPQTNAAQPAGPGAGSSSGVVANTNGGNAAHTDPSVNGRWDAWKNRPVEDLGIYGGWFKQAK